MDNIQLLPMQIILKSASGFQYMIEATKGVGEAFGPPIKPIVL
jgi:hypothetical protein